MLLAHQKIAELPHGSLRFRDGLFHRRNASLRFFNGTQKRVAFFVHDGQQFYAQSLDAALACGLDECAAGILNQALQRIDQLSPIALRASLLQPLCRTDFEDKFCGPVQALCQQPLGERNGRGPLRRACFIRLVENDDQMFDMLGH